MARASGHMRYVWWTNQVVVRWVYHKNGTERGG